MRERRRLFSLMAAGTLFFVALWLAVWCVPPAVGVTLAQEPQSRPPLPGPNPNPSSGGEGEGGAAPQTCSGVRGLVMNWGYRNEPDVTVRLSGEAYEISQVTTSDGLYDFRGLGEGYATLQPLLSDTQRQVLNVHTNEVAVRLRCASQPVVNLGLYSGSKNPRPPAFLTVSADATEARPGDRFRLHLKISNGLPTGISKVAVTDLFPAPLSVIQAEASRGQVEILDGKMFALTIGDMARGEELTATVTVQIDKTALVGQEVSNRTSLLYAESMADQVVANLSVGRGVTIYTERDGLVAQPASTLAVFPVIEVPLTVTVAPPLAGPAATSETPFVTPVAPSLKPGTAPSSTLPLTGTKPLTSTVGAPSTLPTTGVDLVNLPLLGLGLFGLAVIARAIRRWVAG